MAKADSKKAVEPKANDEHGELDAAMNELAKQTDALLAETKPKQSEKPKLPKKKSVSKKVVPHRNGQHLDIVGSTMKSGASPKIEAHATKSYNEKDTPKQEPQPTEKASAAGAPQIIRPHEGRTRAGSEPVTPEEKTEEPNQTDKEVDDAAKKTDKPHKTEHMKVEADESESVVAVHSKPKVAPEQAAETEPKSGQEAPKNEEPKPELKPDKDNAKDQPKAEPAPKQTESEGVDSNQGPAKTVLKMDEDEDTDDGIVKMEDDSKPEDGREKPTMYDTTEYQAELHDWSKLSKNSHWSFIILVLLLALAGGLMYLYFTGNLPEIL